MLSRRALLATSAAAGALGLAGWRGAASLSDESLVRSVLERHLGRLVMSEDELSRFAAAFEQGNGYLLPGEKLKIASNVSFDLGMHGFFRTVLPGEDEGEFSRYERQLLAAFHVMTDFPARESAVAPVRYVGDGPCRNPFARFD